MANRIIVDASLERFGMTAAMVLPWLVSSYEEIIATMPLGETTRQVEQNAQTFPPYSVGTVAISAGSDLITGTGTFFNVLFNNAFIRIKGVANNQWLRVSFVDATHLRVFGAISPDNASGLSYVVAMRYGPDPAGLRWITNVKISESPNLAERSEAELDLMYSGRDSEPGLPLYWAKAQWNPAPPYRRYLEFFPPPDGSYYVVITGYAFIDEPILTSFPFAGLSDQLILEGGLAHAFDFIAGKLVEASANIEMVRAALDVAARHRRVFEDKILTASRRDDRDSRNPKVIIKNGASRRRRYGDFSASAEWEVWRRP